VTHIVFVSSGRLLLQSDALHAGANGCVSSDARGEHFTTHVTIARRIADFAASLQRALHDNGVLSTIDELTAPAAGTTSRSSFRAKLSGRRALAGRWPS